MDAEARAKFDRDLEDPKLGEPSTVNGRPVPEGVDPEEQARLQRQLSAIFQMPTS